MNEICPLTHSWTVVKGLVTRASFFPACQSPKISFKAQELSFEFAKLKQPSTSQLYLPLNIKQTEATMLHQVHLHPAASHAQHPDPVGTSGKESLFLPAPHLLPCSGNSTLKSKADCLNCQGGHPAQAFPFLTGGCWVFFVFSFLFLFFFDIAFVLKKK